MKSFVVAIPDDTLTQIAGVQDRSKTNIINRGRDLFNKPFVKGD